MLIYFPLRYLAQDAEYVHIYIYVHICTLLAISYDCVTSNKLDKRKIKRERWGEGLQ